MFCKKGMCGTCFQACVTHATVVVMSPPRKRQRERLEIWPDTPRHFRHCRLLRDRPDHARSRYGRRGCTPSRDIDTHRDGRSCARGARCAAVPGQSRGETEGVFAARRAQVLASIDEMRLGVRLALQLDPEVESWTFVSTLPTVCQSRSSRDLFF